MIVVVMGMSKSGTTLVSKTLHESGINMHPARTGNYNQSKYEDPDIINILLKMFNTNKLQSLYIPEKIIWNRKIRESFTNLLLSRNGNWGFKQPWTTLVYPYLKTLLPPHIAVGIKRDFTGLKSHWTKRNKTVDAKKLYRVWSLYNEKMKLYRIPIISFEYFKNYGPGQLKKIVGMELKDVRV